MAIQAIVIANHIDKTATLNFIDEKSGFKAYDEKGEALTGMNFSYDKILEYDFMFESLGKIDEDHEKFLFKILSA